MSRDPEEHSPLNPNELHKYLYAGGDPVNAVDPTGKESEEYEEEVSIEVTTTVEREATSALKFHLWLAGGGCAYVGYRDLKNPMFEGTAGKVLDAACVLIGTAAFLAGP